MASTPIATHSDTDFVDALAALEETRGYEKGDVIVNEGERGGSVYVIRNGRVQVFSRSKDDKQVLIDEHGPGDYFGEMSLDGGVRSASVQAMENCEISVVERETVLAFIEVQPAWSLNLIFELSRRLRLATDNFCNLALFDVYGRVARVLQSLADASPGRQ